MKRTASAEWKLGLKDGEGKVSTQSGALSDLPYSYRTRFESAVGTNPEELIAAAHAGCFSMALSWELQKAGFIPDTIHSDAILSFERVEGEWTITEVQLNSSARVPGLGSERFSEIAEVAKSGCPVSRALKAKINLRATLLPMETMETAQLRKASGL